MKTACVYHSIDQDGYMSAAIVKHRFNQQEVPNKQGEDCNTIDFIGYNHGQPIPDLSEYDEVIMVDISFPANTMWNLTCNNRPVIWIDHHISAIKDIENQFNNHNVNSTILNGLRDTNFAACELTWQYFFHNEPMPEIVRLLGRYDCFGHKGTDEELKVLEFQYGARQCISNYEDAYTYLIDTIDDSKDGLGFYTDISTLGRIHIAGIHIYKYLYQEAKEVYKNGFEIIFKSTPKDGSCGIALYKFICINKERFNPINFGIDYHKDGYDGCACFHYDGIAKLWRFSLYNDNEEVDCSIIAKQFGGGGHKGAAEFVLNQEQFNNLIK